jgi:alginate O-acetyltransferase complex protein AlgI
VVFTSVSFLFLFLPVFLIGYYLTPTRWRMWPLLFFSYVFYGWARLDFLALLIGATLWTFLCGQALHKARADGDILRARRVLILGVGLNLAVLIYFKYADFGIESVSSMLMVFGLGGLEPLGIVLPVGISFIVLHSISYLADLYRNDAPNSRSLLEFSVYMAMFPQLIAGPIIRYKDVAHQFQRRDHSIETFNGGALRFMVGFSKKVLIADAIAPIATIAFAQPAPTFADAWLGTIAYTLQIYYDFSAYSDMAIGLGLMIGFRFLENFRSPYDSRSITEFWRRWHISLSNWLRDYLYIPLGGNRRGTGRTYVNLLTVMLFGGLWHGAAWTFVAWGAWHGSLLAFERRAGVRMNADLPRARGHHAGTLILVMIGWVLFRADDLGAAMRMFAGLVGLHESGRSPAMLTLGMFPFIVLAATALWTFLAPASVRDRLRVWRFPGAPGLAIQTVACVVFAFAVLRLSSSTYTPFLYFRF